MSIRINRTIAAAVVLLGVMGCSVHRVSAQATLTPAAYQTVSDSAGLPISGACIWTYLAGTSTPAATYTSKAATVSNTNPIVTDSAGQYVAYLTPGQSYKFVFETACIAPAHGAVLRTQDGIDGVFNVFSAVSFTGAVAGDESLTIRNTLAGIINRGVLFLGNDASATLATLAAHSSTFTTSGAAIANGVKLTASGVGGLSLQASDATGIIHFFTGTGTVERGQITAAGLWNWTAFGAHQFAASGTGGNSLAVSNTAAGVGNFGQLRASSDTVLTALTSFSSTYTTAGPDFQAGTSLFAGGSGGLSINAFGGPIRLYTGSGTLRWGVNAAGDLTQGTSSNIIDSIGVPTIGAGCGSGPSVVGNDYFFSLNTGGSASTTCTVNFGHIMSAAGCTANATTAVPIGVTGGASAVIFTYGSATGLAITAICRGR
jgi:hypothetical protein